jgi:hypothetical protein
MQNFREDRIQAKKEDTPRKGQRADTHNSARTEEMKNFTEEDTVQSQKGHTSERTE